VNVVYGGIFDAQEVIASQMGKTEGTTNHTFTLALSAGFDFINALNRFEFALPVDVGSNLKPKDRWHIFLYIVTKIMFRNGRFIV
jgi:hypothetical protein